MRLSDVARTVRSRHLGPCTKPTTGPYSGLPNGIIGRQQLAEDVTQQVFIELFSSIGRYDSRRPFPPWLHRIAVSRSLDELRRRKNKPLPLEDAGELRSELPSPEEAAERSETQAAVQGRLRRSSPSTGPPWYSVTTTGSAKQR